MRNIYILVSTFTVLSPIQFHSGDGIRPTSVITAMAVHPQIKAQGQGKTPPSEQIIFPPRPPD